MHPLLLLGDICWKELLQIDNSAVDGDPESFVNGC
jgi:hypothetical protein